MNQTANQVYERYMRIAQAGIMTDESRWKRRYIYDKMDTHRSQAIQLLWSKGRIINPIWIQTYFPEFSEDLQESDCDVVFEVPPFITLDTISDGLIGVGNGMCRIPRVRTINELRSYQKIRATKNATMCIWQEGVVKVYGNGLILEELECTGIWLQPTMLPTFNTEIDIYPACQMVLAQMEDLWKKDLQTIGVLDYVPDSAENQQNQPKK